MDKFITENFRFKVDIAPIGTERPPEYAEAVSRSFSAIAKDFRIDKRKRSGASFVYFIRPFTTGFMEWRV